MGVAGLIGDCCGGGGRRLGHCDLFYAGVYSALDRVLEALRGDAVGFARGAARDNMYELSSGEFWGLLYREYFYPVLAVAAAYNGSRGGGCFGRVFAGELEKVLGGGEYMGLSPGGIGLSWGNVDETSMAFLGVAAELVRSTARGMAESLPGVLSREALALLNEELLADLIAEHSGEAFVVYRSSGVYGGLTEVLLWLLASRLSREGFVSGVLSLEGFLGRRGVEGALAARNRVVLLSYDRYSRDYMVLTGHVPREEFEVWVSEEAGVVSLNIFVLRSLKAGEALYRVWGALDSYL